MKTSLSVSLLSLAFLLLAACAPQVEAALPASPASPEPAAAETVLPPAPAPTSTPLPVTPRPSPTPKLYIPDLPEPFDSELLRGNDTPHTYIEDTCQYLRMRWDGDNSPPGTVVMAIMFHSITEDTVQHADQVTVERFRELMQELKRNNFQAITTRQLADFLESNARIPYRSVVLIVDDRKRGQFFDRLFREYWEKEGWPVVNAWISVPDTPQIFWNENIALAREGWVEYQAHGVVHNIPVSDFSTDEYILSELAGSMQTIEQRFGNRPIAYIWPGGGFSARSVELARETGYRLGFTVNPRGPLMFNWIPLADAWDERRTTYLPEGLTGDPLMVLPRFWDTDAIRHIERVVQIGRDAAAYAVRHKNTELQYYDIVCKTIIGELSPAAP